MHPNPIYHDADAARNLAFARDVGFGVLAVNGAAAPMLSHVPFLLSDDGAVVDLHLVRSNPIARALKSPMTASIAISGPHGYISPDWYGIVDQVPTWNYVAVHLTGQLELRPQDELRDLLDRQSGHFENLLLPKTPWRTDKMTPEVMDKMMRQIVPIRMMVTGVDGTWKLNQNKADDVRLRAADGVQSNDLGVNTDALSTMMRDAK
jgi:transcriptional regulator